VEDQTRFVETFSIRGNYVIRPQGVSDTRIISLNSIYFSSNNNYRQQGWLQLKWIEGQLAAAQKKAERVWIVTHIPPGVDVYSTLHSPGNVITYWDESTRNEEGRTYLQQFQYLMRQYASVINGVFSGHSHMDHFRLVPREDNDPGGVAFVHVTPAVSPQFDNNAAFELLRYDNETLNVLDYETHYFDQGLSEWEREYDFGEIYRKFAMTPSGLWGIRESLEKNRAVRSMFIKFYDVNNPDSVPIDRSNWKAYWCAISELTPVAFSACYP
jgi:sphingomyelin phosphodiesterase acid-like 3